jgi:hypothetical protein
MSAGEIHTRSGLGDVKEKIVRKTNAKKGKQY